MRHGILFLGLVFVCAALAPARAAEPSACVTADVALSAPLPRVAAAIAEGRSPRIVALGSSSTSGAGASGPAHAYPARLAAHLAALLPGVRPVVLNKGIGGETDDQMVARIARDVIAEAPDLVIWQVGANTVLRRGDTAAAEAWIRQGIERLRPSGADIVLMDIQYARNTLANPEGAADMLRRTARVAAEERLGLFHRYRVMQDAVEAKRANLAELIGPDGTHQTDAGYDCVALALAHGIRDALQPQRTALAPAR